MRRVRPVLAITAAIGILVLGCVAYLSIRQKSPNPGVVRIGINNSPPYCFINPDGSPGGFSVEVLTEAARRQGIVLQWIAAPEGPDSALRSGKVDVWHILTDIPSRHTWAYFTDPWLRTQFVLAVRKGGAIKSATDMAGRPVSHTGNVIQSRLAHQFFPQSSFVAEEFGKELSGLCRGDAQGAFIDVKHLVPRLLDRDPDCASFPFDLIPLDGASFQLAIGANRKGFDAAKALRAGITNMAQDQSLDYLYRKWLRDTVDETRIVNDLMDVRQRWRLVRTSAVILGAIVILLAILMFRERTVRHAIKSAYEFASAALDTAGGLVFISDRYGRIVRFNRACERATGKTLQEIRNKISWQVFVPTEERPAVQAMFAQLAGGTAHARHEHHWQTIDGPRLFSWSNTILMGKAGRVDYIIATGIDISDREAAERRLGYEATHDPLTNLLNRRQFLRELEAAFITAKAGSAPFTVVLADLDHFKVINDSHGHEAGDDVLVYFARLLRSELGPCDVAGRLGGDEFCLLIRRAGAADTLARISTRLLDHEFCASTGKTFHSAVSFGLAAWRGATDTPIDLLRAADQSLYLAKDRGPNRLSQFESEIATLTAELTGNLRLTENIGRNTQQKPGR